MLFLCGCGFEFICSHLNGKSPSNSTYSNYTRFQISISTNNFGLFVFFFNLRQKRILPVKIRKNERHHRILHTRRILFRFFWSKFAQNGFFWRKIRKVSITTELCIFELVQVPNFNSNWQFRFFWPKFRLKMVFLVNNGKCEHHHWVLHIQIRIGTKIQLKLNTLVFWSKFTQKWYFWLKKENWTSPLKSRYSNWSGYQISD